MRVITNQLPKKIRKYLKIGAQNAMDNQLYSGNDVKNGSDEANDLVGRDERTLRSCDSGEKPLVRPNCFLAIPILSEQIKTKFKDIQNTIVEKEQRLKSAMVAEPTIHLTLKVFYLENSVEISRARIAMDRAVPKLRDTIGNLPLRVDVCGIGSFGSNILFAKLVPGPGLDAISNMAEILEDSFRENGLEPTDKRPFSPHITILKLSKAKSFRWKALKASVAELRDLLKEETFGSEYLTRIDLCAMGEEKDSHGYYHIIHQVNLLEQCS